MEQKRPTRICRLCLAPTATFFSLTGSSDDALMLEALTCLIISPSDRISTVMCLKCRLNLKLAFSIRQKMLQAEALFHSRKIRKFTQEVAVKEDPDTDLPESPNQGFPVDEELDASADPPPVQCDICSKTYLTKMNLRVHKYNVHNKRKCPICGKELTQGNLRRHMQRHDDPQTICELCGSSMKAQDLRSHIFHQHTEHSYKCDFCEMVFTSKRRKSVHETREHLDASFVCDTCGKKFYTSRHLNTHVKMKHLKLRPHKCDFCNVGFSSKFALKTHRRQHTNETPFRCDVCGEGFKQKVSMKNHLKSKHNIEEELTCECTVCGKKFSGQAALMAHSRVH